MEKKLQVHHLRMSFRTVSGKLQAVRDISFDLYKGETLAIVGESGSGKSVTSKAILGISAANAIVEGGEILYDGMDLLKISEDDFYRIRGDKVTMIFQDPLSSLNPIMRVGKQLTEAMLLKGKARQISSKKNFDEKLKLLQAAMVDCAPDDAENARKQCEMFRKFEMCHIELEQAYNASFEAANETLVETEDIAFLIEKKAMPEKREAKLRLREVGEFALKAINPFVVSARADELRQAVAVLTAGLSEQIATKDYSQAATQIAVIDSILREAIEKTKPNFFAMGYFRTFGTGDVPQGTMEEQNTFYASYLDEHFLNRFMEMTERAMVHLDAAYLRKREGVVATMGEMLQKLDEYSIEEFKPLAAELCRAVDDSINPIDVVKDSAACTFSGSMNAFVNTYFEGKKTNGGKVKKYNRRMARYNRLASRGKTPDWKVVAADTIDLNQVKINILRLMQNLKAHYEARNAAENDVIKGDKAARLIDDLKDNASGMVLRITKRAAKNRALKLMDEVGIDHPRTRYRQYPFEFSGGMRQRIVIAIALAANPDILICDEPTTALDVTIQAQILELINRLKKQRNLSIIFITHDLGVVANMADRIAVMYAGKIVEYGTAEEVFYQPAHPYTWALLSSMPDLNTKDKLEAIPGTPPNMIYPPVGDAFAERNRYAMQIDFEQQPPEFKVSDTHWAATWLLHPNAPKVEPPKTVTERIAAMKARMEANANG